LQITIIHEVRWLPNDVEAKLEQLTSAISQAVTAINNLDRKVDTMSSNLDRIEKEAADAAENVGLVRTAIEELKTVSANMQAEITALKEQVAQGQIDQARLDAAVSVFEKADDDIDAMVLPAPTPDEGGTNSGDTTTTEGGSTR
jgi:chromosome segregation ATPase